MSIGQKVSRAKSLAQFFWAQRVTGFSVPDEPLLDDEATVALREHLDRAKFYLEFGTGGSTVLVARRGLETISVDNDKFFLGKVKEKLAPGHRVTPVLVDIGLSAEWGMPLFKTLDPQRVAAWRRYVDAPFEIIAQRGRFPDFILVDGRFRAGCALESARQAQRAGASTTIMIDDYAQRDHYVFVERHLGVPRMAGRAALFDVGDGHPAPISEAVVAEAMKDYR